MVLEKWLQPTSIFDNGDDILDRTSSMPFDLALLDLIDPYILRADSFWNWYAPSIAHPAPSEYASTEFTLDLLLTTIILRVPFLLPAKLMPNGQLVEDKTKARVEFTLPRIKVRLAQGSANNDPLTVDLLSLGASGLDDASGLGVAHVATMDPHYPFSGPSQGRAFAFP